MIILDDCKLFHYNGTIYEKKKNGKPNRTLNWISE